MSTETPKPRPATSKARGVCRYYLTERGCFNGPRCKFLHANPLDELAPSAGPTLTPYDQSKTCRFYAQGYCKHGDKCWFRHEFPELGVISPDIPGPSQPAPALTKLARLSEEEDVCCICLEKPHTYGLLAGCSHVFCLECIRQWREPSGKSLDVVDSGVNKKCPLCRAASQFVTPSSLFWPSSDPGKAAAIAQYKASMARTPCRYFRDSKLRLNLRLPSPFCPFGKDCFYQHLNDDGTTYIFLTGVDSNLRRYLSATSADGYLTYPPTAPEFRSEPSNSAIGRRIEDLVVALSDLFRQPGRDEAEIRRLNVALNAILDLEDAPSTTVYDSIVQSAALSRIENEVTYIRTGQRPIARAGVLETTRNETSATAHLPRRNSVDSLPELYSFSDYDESTDGSDWITDDDDEEGSQPALEARNGTNRTLEAMVAEILERINIDGLSSAPDMPILEPIPVPVPAPTRLRDTPTTDDDDSMPPLEVIPPRGDQTEDVEAGHAFSSNLATTHREETGSPISSGSPRFSTVVQRTSLEAPTHSAEDIGNLESTRAKSPEAPPPATGSSHVQSPFVTDGRGRVVWTPAADEPKTAPPQAPAPRSPSTASQSSETASPTSASPNLQPEFTTDGRGRVIATNTEDGSPSQSLIETVRQSIARMFDI